MSITLGNYTVETKKTVGELPIGSDNIIATPPCVSTIDPSLVQPKWKKIHQYNFTDTLTGGISTPFGDDDVYADGFDYKIVIDNIVITGSPILTTFAIFGTASGIAYDISTTGTTIVPMNEFSVGGSYGNSARFMSINDSSGSTFQISMDFTIYQLVPATIEIELCGGGKTVNVTQLAEESVFIPHEIEGGGIGLGSVVYNRSETYTPDPSIMPTSCNGFSIYYDAIIASSANTLTAGKSFFIDAMANETQISVANPLGVPLDIIFFDGTNYLFAQSDSTGFVDWTGLNIPLPTTNLNLQVWIGATQLTSYGTSTIKFRYDVLNSDCPCECDDNCGGINVIFNQSCGTSYGLHFNLAIQDGKYNVAGESYTQGGQIIKPITKTKATYDFVITDYSDETFELLMNLIADNLNIEVVDNIDPLNPNTIYYIDTESLDVSWNFNSKLGSLTIPVIKESSISTRRKNCCS
jgi:hypothetical protein